MISSMNYIEVRIRAGERGVEPLIAELAMMGLTDLAIEDPADIAALLEKKNAYDWDYIDDEVLALGEAEPKVTLYLAEGDEGRETLARIRAGLAGVRVDAAAVDDGAWKRNQRDFFRTLKVTERLLIKPTWEEYDRKPGELVIELDPGMAFGTGAHATTAMCLKLMEGCAGSFKSVLDVGCGSGILSIAAALLGAEAVLGVEADSEAIAVARENIRVNALEAKISVIPGDLTRGLDFKADLAVANLMAELVIMLAGDIGKNLEPGGVFISSGIIAEKLAEVSRSIEEAGFEIVEVLTEGEWRAVKARVSGAA